ncbi:hypothetical protein SK128_018758 [Halocaridina rubra]|uniref:Uncharacterized protein n=1 Tax=Halocaridina rubra TaxID=373956 RepID=A0AAN9FUV6_HALRR
MEAYIPSSMKTFSPPNPWFDHACSIAIQTRDRADQSYQASPSDLTRIAFIVARNLSTTQNRRLSAVSHHLTLDRSRGWREIEAEWADAEAAEKRRQLQSSQRTLKTRAQRDATHRLCSLGSRSLGNLSAALKEEENEEITAFREGSVSSYTHTTPKPIAYLSSNHIHYKPTLRNTRSSSDVTDDTSHKIALVTSADPHVNNIVVLGGPKDEKDAVSRLEELSSPSASRTSTLSSGPSQVTVRSSSGSLSSATGGSSGNSSSKDVSPRIKESVVEQQLRELREEQRKLQEEAHRLAEERRKFEEERRRGLERTQSAPLAPLVINCSGQSLPPQLLQSPPSPTSSIASGRHTTRVLIKSPPPPPPPRKNTTILSSRQSSHPHQVSPPASPAHSSSSSSGLGSLCGSGAPPRRCKSIGSLSASSSESTVWEDLPASHPVASSTINANNNSHYHSTFRSNMPPPPPPKPSAPLSSSQANHTNKINESKVLGGVPPPPPPPPPQALSSNPQPSLAAALTKELERRNAQDMGNLMNLHIVAINENAMSPPTPYSFTLILRYHNA